ncbi:hypothetical protein ADENT20671_0893 [Actinomyces denticolens]|nr:hypothetical protein ADENT20671_0893 [Actinomyces denticolens]
MLARTGLRDEAGLAHALGQEGLPEGVVALVGTAVDEVLALEDDAGPGAREAAALVQGRGAAEVSLAQVLELGEEAGIVDGLGVGGFELVERG